MNDLWPDDEQLEKRRKALHKRIDTMLNAGRCESDGGWAKVSDEEYRELQEICREVIDLKVERDSDGDSAVEVVFVNRNQYRLESFYIPNDNGHEFSDAVDDEARGRAIQSAISTANHMISAGNRLLELIAISAGWWAQKEAKKKEVRKALEVFPKRFADKSEDFDAIMEDFVEFQRKNNDHFGETEKPFAEAQRAAADYWPERLVAAADEINALQKTCKSDRDEGFYHKVIVPRVRYGRTFGKAFYVLVDEEATRLVEEGRRIRKAQQEVAKTSQ